MIRAILIDDEFAARDALKHLLARHFPHVTVAETCGSVAEAVPILQQQSFDVAFLDIVMPQAYGFELFDHIGTPEFGVIFTTAYDTYAIKAFEFSALDYLLKPINHQDLARAIAKVENQQHVKETQQKLSILRQNWHSEDPQLVLPTAEGYHLLRSSEIVFCQSQGNYTLFRLMDRKDELISKTLKEFEILLADFQFARVHRSYLINAKHVRKIYRDNRLEMVNGDEVPISQNRKPDFIKNFLSHE
jgi:two-component system LytT family response regulator